MKRTMVGLALAGGILLTACGGGSNLPEGVSLPVPAAGPVPNLPVSEEAAAESPLPEVTVRQINGDGGFVQLKNELPSDKPLLVWFWAPH